MLAFERGASKYSLWIGGYDRNGRPRPKIAAKHTIEEIENQYGNGYLQPYVDYLRSLGLIATRSTYSGSEDQEVVHKGLRLETTSGGLNRQANLLPGQVSDRLLLHSRDLQSEAGRWRDLILAFNQGDRRFDYATSDLYFMNSSSPITAFFSVHLEKEVSSVYNKCGLWFEQARTFSLKVDDVKRRWEMPIVSRLGKEAGDASNENSWGPYFLLSLWSSILEDHTNGFSSLSFNNGVLGESPHVIMEEGDWHLLCFSPRYLAWGDDQWPKRAKDLHQSVYEEQKHLLPNLIEEQGLFEEQRRITELSEDISHRLDMICRGWTVFKPGNCDFCAQLLG